MLECLIILCFNSYQWIGNGLTIPAGPLRELKSRLDSVDLVVGKYLAKKSEISFVFC